MAHFSIAELTTDVAAFLSKHLQSPASALSFTEAQAGNVNCVLICTASTCGRSVVLKLPRHVVDLGVKNARLPNARTLLEAFALRNFSALGLGNFPRVLFCSEAGRLCLVMEEISNRLEWDSLTEEERLELVRIDIAPFLAGFGRNLLPHFPDNISLTSKRMQNLIKRVTFQLPFTARSSPYEKLLSNPLSSELDKRVARIRSNPAWLATGEELLSIYMNRRQFLIHGDLHIDSILISRDRRLRAYIIDPEFACLSVREFDAGVFIAHVLMAATAAANQSYGLTTSEINSYADKYVKASVSPKLPNANVVVAISKMPLDTRLIRAFLLIELFAKFSGPVPSRHLQRSLATGRGEIVLSLLAFLEAQISLLSD
jgi:5-methylthioribose kinase